MRRRAVVQPGADDRPVERAVLEGQRLGVGVAPRVRRVRVVAAALVDVRDRHVLEAGGEECVAVGGAARDDEDAVVPPHRRVVERPPQRPLVEALALAHARRASCSRSPILVTSSPSTPTAAAAAATSPSSSSATAGPPATSSSAAV